MIETPVKTAGIGLAVRYLVRDKHGWKVSYPRLEFCTDNGAMIAYAGCQRLLAGESEGPAIYARGRWPLDTLRPAGAA